MYEKKGTYAKKTSMVCTYTRNPALHSLPREHDGYVQVNDRGDEAFLLLEGFLSVTDMRKNRALSAANVP